MLMIAARTISLDDAYRHIDFRMLVLLFGTRVLIAHLRMARFFSATVQWNCARVHQPALLLVAIVFASGILSALFVNDTICILFTPPIELARRAAISRSPSCSRSSPGPTSAAS